MLPLEENKAMHKTYDKANASAGSFNKFMPSAVYTMCFVNTFRPCHQGVSTVIRDNVFVIVMSLYLPVLLMF